MRTSAPLGRLGTIISTTLVIVMIGSSAFATHVTPTEVSGNPTCITLTDDPDALEFRINSPTDNDTTSIGGAVTYTDPVTGFSVTIDIYQSATGPEFNFYDASIPLDSVFVKGGPKGNLYEYDPAVTADTGLHSPLNPSNGKWYGLSHISFCWVPRPGTILTVSSVSPGTTIHEGDDVTITVAETNDGTVVLDNPTVDFDPDCDTFSFLSGDTDGDGDLDPGETWLFRCVYTDVAADFTATATGSGITPEGDNVTWCANPSNPPADTICDQRERTSVNIDVINPSTDLDLDASSSATTIHVGDQVTLVFAETNDGDVPLDAPDVNANNGCNPVYQSGDTDSDGDLDPGETWLFSCTITPSGDVTVTATGTGVDPLGFTVTWCSNPASPPANTVCDQDERVQVPVTVLAPSTDLSLDASSDATTIHAGDDVTLVFAETNDGNAVLDNPTVTANNGCVPAYQSGDTDGDGDLDPGETWLFSCTVSPADDVTITAIGSGVDPLGFTVTWCANPSAPPANTICDQDERVQVPITVIRSSTDLNLDASSSATTIHGGDSVTLVFAETNDGSAVLDSPSVTANNGCTPAYQSGDTDGDGDLDPGETWLFSCTITPANDVTITAIGSGVDPLGFTVTWCSNPSAPPANTICDQDERVQVPITVHNPSTDLNLDASSSETTIPPGGSVTLVFAEVNDGDVTLDNPQVTADNGCTPIYQSGDTDGDGDLDPGETWLFSCTITPAASVTITAIGSGTDPLGFNVTWCSDPANPPANTVCDQEERVQVPITVSFEGCTPGYWKTHPEAWVGYSSAQTVEAVFNVPDSYGLDNDTLLAALGYQGGTGTVGAARILLRAAVAALLNAAHPDIDYPLTEAQIISQVNAALSGSRASMLWLAQQLDGYNNAGCPL